jgi:hypothetical protein
MRVLVPIVLSILVTSAAGAQEPPPDACVSGFVWREAFAGDHVCVTPAARTQAATDNGLAASRRQPGGGAYGPNTCRAGFVWRVARPEDLVCVTADSRSQVANDNQAAESRRVRPVRSLGRSRLGATAVTGVERNAALDRRATTTVSPGRAAPSIQVPAVRPDSGSTRARGFDDNGDPYVEYFLPDGSKRLEQSNGVTVIRPDGTSHFIPYQRTRSNTQAPTPPQLPESGMEWVNYHNKELLDLISALVKGDARQLGLFHTGENKSVGADPFKQIAYRMKVLDALSTP